MGTGLDGFTFPLCPASLSFPVWSIRAPTPHFFTTCKAGAASFFQGTPLAELAPPGSLSRPRSIGKHLLLLMGRQERTGRTPAGREGRHRARRPQPQYYQLRICSPISSTSDIAESEPRASGGNNTATSSVEKGTADEQMAKPPAPNALGDRPAAGNIHEVGGCVLPGPAEKPVQYPASPTLATWNPPKNPAIRLMALGFIRCWPWGRC